MASTQIYFDNMRFIATADTALLPLAVFNPRLYIRVRRFDEPS